MEILSIIIKVLFIVFFFGFCVFIHEFGHLLAALQQGLHVEKFSIGMGPKIWGFRYRQVEYVISWLPFGGYVSLPQLDPKDIPTTSDNKPLPVASPRQRAITAFAGPLFNVLFGFVLATIMWGAGLWMPADSSSVMVTDVPAYLPNLPEGLDEKHRLTALEGKPLPKYYGMTIDSWSDLCYGWQVIAAENGMEALPEKLSLTWVDAEGKEHTTQVTPEANPEWQAGLRQGDRIIKVNGRSFTGGVSEFQQEYVYTDSAKVTLTLFQEGESTREISFIPMPNPRMEGLGFPFFQSHNPIHVHAVQAGSPVAIAGMQDGDQLLALNNQGIIAMRQLETLLKNQQGQDLVFRIARNGEELQLKPIPAGSAAASGKWLGMSFQILVGDVLPDSPAHQAGLQSGDQLIAVSCGENTANALAEVREFIRIIANSNGQPCRVTFLRDGKEESVMVTPGFNQDSPTPSWQIGVVLSSEMPKRLAHVNPWTQFTTVIGTTTRTLGLLFRPLTSKISGAFSDQPQEKPKANIGLRHMSGPLGILLVLWSKIQTEGYRGGFAFIILITFSLAFMNLLPLPVLDGGHILFAGLEGLIHRRIPAKVLVYIYNIFAGLLIALMLYITIFDGKRSIRLAEKSFGKSDSKEQTQPAKQAPAVKEEGNSAPAPADTVPAPAP